MPFPLLASRPLATTATALATARDPLRQFLWPDGALARAFVHLGQVAASIYDIATMTFWAAALSAAARLWGASWARNLFALVLAVSAALSVLARAS
jgi:hypothetical protein